jgi:hypothetical protein
MNAVEPAVSQVLERPAEGVSSRARALESWLVGTGAALLVAALGLSHGGYFATAWGPLTIAFLAVSVAALAVRPRPALGLRELALPVLVAIYAALALTSALWGTPTEAVPEAQRALAYTAGALAFALVVRRARVAALLVGLWAGICVVCLDALAGRLFPERFAEFDAISVYRLSEPVGYWNALGVLAGFGLLLSISLAARAESLVVRLVAAASTVPLALTLYFTFSRGAWLALLAGLVVTLVLDPRRLQLVVTVLAVAPWPALAVWIASRSDPLTEPGHTLAQASADGHTLAAVAVGLALFAAGAAALVAGVAPRVSVSGRALTAGNVALAGGLVAALALAVIALGGPRQIADSFAAPPTEVIGSNLNDRLFDLSGNGRVEGWRVALDVAEEHPFLGSGGGSYGRYWLAQRPFEGAIRDAHSLYVETLAEYGALGLAVVVALFLVPLAVAVRLRHRPLVPAAAGVVALYAVHSGFDWDWEFPVLTLVALAAATAVLGSADARPSGGTFERRRVVLLAAAVALVPVAAFLGLGARAAAASADAASARDYGRAVAEARSAERLAPWSVEPLLLLGRAEVGSGDRRAAAETFRRATRHAPESWRAWYELAAVTRGAERANALARARALNPREDLLDELEPGA